jgi:hypothetical protein
MNRDQFNKLIDETFTKIKNLSNTKGEEYSGQEDALANFKRNAERMGLDPLQVWFVYTAKHFDSVSTFIKDIASNKVRNYSEPIDGRADDLIVYFLIFKALYKEKLEQNTKALSEIR